METYIVAGNKPWTRRVFNEVISKYPGNWYFVHEPSDLSADTVSSLSPRYIFCDLMQRFRIGQI